jgi:hypothetical protein
MPKISKELVVAAPADAVWRVLGPGFAHIGDGPQRAPRPPDRIGGALDLVVGCRIGG